MPVNRPISHLPGAFKLGNQQKGINLTEKPLQLMQDIVKITGPWGYILNLFAGERSDDGSGSAAGRLSGGWDRDIRGL